MIDLLRRFQHTESKFEALADICWYIIYIYILCPWLDDAHAWPQVVHRGLHHQHGLDKAHRPWRLSCLALPLISVAMREVRVLNRSCCRPQRCLALAILDLRLQQGRWFGHNLLSHREKEVQLGRFLLGHLLEPLFGVPRSKRRQVKHREVKIKKVRKHTETC